MFVKKEKPQEKARGMKDSSAFQKPSLRTLNSKAPGVSRNLLSPASLHVLRAGVALGDAGTGPRAWERR